MSRPRSRKVSGPLLWSVLRSCGSRDQSSSQQVSKGSSYTWASFSYQRGLLARVGEHDV